METIHCKYFCIYSHCKTMKITSEKAPSETGRHCKGRAIAIINKTSVWLQHKIPEGTRQCRAVARRVTHPSVIVYVEDETSFMVFSVLFAQMSWQKILLLFIYRNLAPHVCNSVWTRRTDLLTELYLPSVRRNVFVPCVLALQACIVTLSMKVKDALSQRQHIWCNLQSLQKTGKIKFINIYIIYYI